MVKNNVYLTKGEKIIIQVGIGFIYQYFDKNEAAFKKFLSEQGYANSVTKKKIRALVKKVPIN